MLKAGFIFGLILASILYWLLIKSHQAVINDTKSTQEDSFSHILTWKEFQQAIHDRSKDTCLVFDQERFAIIDNDKTIQIVNRNISAVYVDSNSVTTIYGEINPGHFIRFSSKTPHFWFHNKLYVAATYYKNILIPCIYQDSTGKVVNNCGEIKTHTRE